MYLAANGGDSLLGTEMLLELGEVARHPIAPSDLRAELTIRHLVRVLARQVAAKKEVITQARSGRGTPLFFWHGDYEGWGLYAFRFAALLKGDGRVYLLHSILDPVTGIETIEEMWGSNCRSSRRWRPPARSAWPDIATADTRRSKPVPGSKGRDGRSKRSSWSTPYRSMRGLRCGSLHGL